MIERYEKKSILKTKPEIYERSAYNNRYSKRLF